MAIGEDKQPVTMFLNRKLVKRIDGWAKKMELSRADFCEELVEITAESDGPIIDFSLELGRVARVIWPRKKVKVPTT